MTMTIRQQSTRQRAIPSMRTSSAATLAAQPEVGIHQKFAQIAQAIDDQTSALQQTTEALQEGFAKQDELNLSLKQIAQALSRYSIDSQPGDANAGPEPCSELTAGPLSEDQKNCLRAIQSAEQLFLDKSPADLVQRTSDNNQALSKLASSKRSAEVIPLFERIDRTEWSEIIGPLDAREETRAHRLRLCHALRGAVMSDSRLADSPNNVPAQQT